MVLENYGKAIGKSIHGLSTLVLSLLTVNSNKKKERKPRYDTGQNHGLINHWCYPGFNKL